MTLAVMIVLAAAVAAWVLAPLLVTGNGDGSRRGVTSDPPSGGGRPAGASASDGAGVTRHEAPREA